MDADDLFSSRPDDPLTLLQRQDIEALSVEDLHERIAVLEAEIERARARIAFAGQHRASADALFQK